MFSCDADLVQTLVQDNSTPYRQRRRHFSSTNSNISSAGKFWQLLTSIQFKNWKRLCLFEFRLLLMVNKYIWLTKIVC